MGRQAKILIVGDAALCAALAEQLEHAGDFALLAAHGAEEAAHRLADDAPDTLILDADLLGVEAEALARRASGRRVILLGGHPLADSGAIFRLARPVRVAQLLALINAPLEATARQRIVLGAFLFDPESHSLSGRNGETIALTEKEAAILARLTQQRDAPTPRDILLRDVWGYNPDVDSRTLETHVHRLRRKIESDPAHPRLLLTEDGGYRIAAPEETQEEA